MSVAIVAVVYLEPEYAQTRACVEATGLPVVWVDRKPAGVGSLARAYNEGFAKTNANLVWMVSNVTFGPDMLPALVRAMEDNPDFACVHPPFASDWPWCHPNGRRDVVAVPFVEFTAPLVRSEAFRALPLDERMPYWGHDLDWGHRARAAGWKVGVDHSAPELSHVYMRNSAQIPITKRRHDLRKQSNIATKRVLTRLYGPQWKQFLMNGA